MAFRFWGKKHRHLTILNYSPGHTPSGNKYIPICIGQIPNRNLFCRKFYRDSYFSDICLNIADIIARTL
jgi:hypothetical protein